MKVGGLCAFPAPCLLAILVLALQSEDYRALKKGCSQFCMAFVVNSVVWSLRDLHLNLFHSFCAWSGMICQFCVVIYCLML